MIIFSAHNMTGPIRHVSIKIDDLAELIFMKNKTNTKIELQLGGIRNNKDLFCFIVDLLCKGLVYMYANGGNQVILDNLTMQEFSLIALRMAAAGIKITLHVDNNNHNVAPCVFMGDDFDSLPENQPLEEYQFKIVTPIRMYTMMFELIH